MAGPLDLRGTATVLTAGAVRNLNALGGAMSAVASKAKASGTAATTYMGNAGKSAQHANKRMSRMTGGMSGTGMVGLGAAAGSFGFLRRQYDLEKALNRARAILDIDQSEFKPLTNEVERLGAKYPLTMLDAAKASIEAGQAGMKRDTQIAVFEQAVKGATASGESVQTVVAGVTDLIYGLGLPFKTGAEQTESFRRANDLLAASAVSANQDYGAFLRSFQKGAPVFRAVGVSMEDGAAFIGALANAGIKAEKSGTSLRTMLIKLLDPSKKVLGMLDGKVDLGKYIKAGSLSEATGGGLANFLGSTVGIDAGGLAQPLDAILKDPALAGNISALQGRLTQAVVDNLGENGQVLAPEVASAVTDFLTMGMQRVDLGGLLSALNAAKVPPGVYKELFGLRHVEKGLALGSQISSGQLVDLMADIKHKLRYEIDQMTGVLKGPVDRFMDIMQSGYAGKIDRMFSAFDLMMRKMAKSGALDTVADAIGTLTNGIVRLSNTNPDTLYYITIGLLGLGALAPLGLILSAVAGGLVTLASGVLIAGGLAGRIAKLTGALLGLSKAGKAVAPMFSMGAGVVGGAAAAGASAKMIAGMGGAAGLAASGKMVKGMSAAGAAATAGKGASKLGFLSSFGAKALGKGLLRFVPGVGMVLMGAGAAYGGYQAWKNGGSVGAVAKSAALGLVGLDGNFGQAMASPAPTTAPSGLVSTDAPAQQAQASVNAARQAASQIKAELTQGMHEAGVQAMAQFAAGISAGGSQAVAAARRVGSQVKSATGKVSLNTGTAMGAAPISP